MDIFVILVFTKSTGVLMRTRYRIAAKGKEHWGKNFVYEYRHCNLTDFRNTKTVPVATNINKRWTMYNVRVRPEPPHLLPNPARAEKFVVYANCVNGQLRISNTDYYPYRYKKNMTPGNPIFMRVPDLVKSGKTADRVRKRIQDRKYLNSSIIAPKTRS